MDALDDFIKAFELGPSPASFGPPPPPPAGGSPQPPRHVSPVHGEVAFRPIDPPQPLPPPVTTHPTPSVPAIPVTTKQPPSPVIPATGIINSARPASDRPAVTSSRKGTSGPPPDTDYFSLLLRKKDQRYEDYILNKLDSPTVVVARFVCKTWRERLNQLRPPAPSKKGATARARALAGGEAFTAELAKHGYAGVLRWATQKEGCPVSVETCASIALEKGYLEVIKWARDNNWKSDAKSTATVAQGGYLELLQYLKAVNTPWDGRVVYLAVLNGHDEVARWAFANGCPALWEYDFWKEACQKELATGIRTGFALKTSGLPPDRVENVWRSAVKEGDLSFMKWLRRYWAEEITNCYWSRNTTAFVTGQGRIDVLKWLREEGCHWDESTCKMAAKRGDFDTLKWARENECPWGPSVCAVAAAKGRLDILKWLREGGCEWDETTLNRAKKKKQKAVLDWATANNAPTRAKRKSTELLSDFLSQMDKKEEKNIDPISAMMAKKPTGPSAKPVPKKAAEKPKKEKKVKEKKEKKVKEKKEKKGKDKKEDKKK